MSVLLTKMVNKLEPAVKKKAYSFLEKLLEDPTAPGLHIEPLKQAADSRVRTGRVDQGYRAILFKLTGKKEVVYVFHGIWPHDEANDLAQRARLDVNPVNGVLDVVYEEGAAPAEPAGPGSGLAAAAPSVTLDVAAEAPTEATSQAPEPEIEVEGEAETAGSLADHGITLEQLVEELGIDADVAERAMQARDEEQLTRVVEAVRTEWQGLALIDLSAGLTIAEVQDLYRLAPVEEVDDEEIVERIKSDAGVLNFVWIESNEELERVIDEGDFGAWRVFLHPEQRKYVDKRYNGSARLSGGAGTGKTVVILHRARALVRRNPQGRVLVTTFTRNLADALRRDLRRLDGSLPIAERMSDVGAHVAGVDAFAAAVVRSAGHDIAKAAEQVLGVATTEVTVDPKGQGRAWADAIDGAGAALPANLRSPAFLAEEYAAVVLPHRITTKDEYLKVRRPGRGVALDRAKRSAVWDVVAAYRAAGRAYGRVDFDEVAALATAHLDLQADTRGRVFDHVLVDEGQDLSPTRWQLLRAAVAEGPDDLFIAEDSHQRIYGQRITLSTYGIRVVGRSRRLRLNYRTTAQVLRWAMSVLDGADYLDVEGEAEDHTGYRSARSGPDVVVLPASSSAEELDVAASTLTGWLADDIAPETVAVLVRDRFQQERVVNGLAERGVQARNVGTEAVRPGQPVVMTMHRSKGTEFGRVLLFGLREGAIPAIAKDQEYDESARTDAELRERSLLYVAATRARDVLAITYSGDPSPLVPLTARGVSS